MPTHLIVRRHRGPKKRRWWRSLPDLDMRRSVARLPLPPRPDERAKGVGWRICDPLEELDRDCTGDQEGCILAYLWERIGVCRCSSETSEGSGMVLEGPLPGKPPPLAIR